jgi:Ca2+-binding EF-hand superfamily protein
MASSSRDVATVDILEKATLPLQSLGIALKDSHKIWKAMGLCLERQLRYGKQIKFENFGTFGFSKTFEPIFIHDSNFLQSNRLKDGNKTSSTMLCSDPINKLSTVQILEENKTIVTTNKEAIKNLFINAIVQVSKFVKEGNRATIRLGFLPVGEWHCDGVTAKMKFVPEFVQKIKNETAKTRGPLRVGRHPCEEEEEEEEDDDDDEKLTASALKKHESSTSKRPSSARSSTLLDSTVSQHQHQPRQVHISVRPQSAHEAGTQEKSVRSSVASSSASAIKKSSSKFKEEAPVTKSAKGKSGSDGRNILERVKNKIIERGGANGINSLSRVLRIMDSSGDGKLCRNELKFGLRDFGIDISPSELEALMCYFDRNKDGQISVEEFLIGIRGDINSRRLGFIHKAFRLMDRTGDGMISVEDLRDNYDVSFFPEVRAGKKSKDQALAEFMSQWDTGEKDGQITLEEFIDYYRVRIQL